jgi:hypothetical protein
MLRGAQKLLTAPPSFVMLRTGVGNAAYNAVAIQAALNKTGTVYAPVPGVFYVDRTCLLDDSSDVYFGPATWLKAAPGTNKKLLPLDQLA